MSALTGRHVFDGSICVALASFYFVPLSLGPGSRGQLSDAGRSRQLLYGALFVLAVPALVVWFVVMPRWQIPVAVEYKRR